MCVSAALGRCGRGGHIVVVGIAGGDPELSERLLRFRLVGAGESELVAARKLGFDQIGGDRGFVARTGEDRAEEDEQEDEGKACEADTDPLHALSDLPAPLSSAQGVTYAGAFVEPRRRRCCEALAEKPLTAQAAMPK